MRKLVVGTFLTLDGVMQAPGGPDEDTSGGFKYGGWTAPFFNDVDEKAGAFMEKSLAVTDLLLGRKTYDVFSAYWPAHADQWPGVNEVKKYVVSHGKVEMSWINSELITGDVVARIKALKKEGDAVIKVIGSGNLAQTLFKHDMVDGLNLMIFPLTLGSGKRLFEEGAIPAAFKLQESIVSSNGVIFANYIRAGEVKTGTVGE